MANQQTKQSIRSSSASSPRTSRTQAETDRKLMPPPPNPFQQRQRRSLSSSPPPRIPSPRSPRRVLTPRTRARPSSLYAPLSNIRQGPGSFAPVLREPDLEEETEEEFAVDMVRQGCSRVEAMRCWSTAEHANLVQRAAERERWMGTERRLVIREAPGSSCVRAGPSSSRPVGDEEDDEVDDDNMDEDRGGSDERDNNEEGD